MELLKTILTDKNNKFDMYEHSIVLAYRGSISHGTYIPKDDPNHIDDKDIMGIVIPPLDYYFGLKTFEQFERIEQYWDIVLYDFIKAVKLFVKSNPNIMQLLWTPEKHILKTTEIFNTLCANRQLFVNKEIYKSYCGYAYSQLKKMTHGAYQGYMGEKRKKLVQEFGFDAKNAQHLIRLLRQGVEFLNTGELIVERPDREELIDIKTGKWSLEKVEREATILFSTMEEAYNNSKLPNEPNVEAINKLVSELLFNYYRRNK